MTIDVLIDKLDNFEIIRDTIAQILADEVASQMALALVAGKDPELWNMKVYTERAHPWEKWLNNTASGNLQPIINVWFQDESFDLAKSNQISRQHADGTFNIDCYAFGVSGDDGGTGHISGDEVAARESHRAARLCRNILMADIYKFLGLPRGLVSLRWVQSITSFQPTQGEATVQNVVATRFALAVSFNEFSPEQTPTTLDCIHVDLKRLSDGAIYAELEFLDGCMPSCDPNFFDDTFWEDSAGTFTWNSGLNRWETSMGVGFPVSLSPIGGWNSTTFLPTKLFITVVAPDADPDDLPFTIDVVLTGRYGDILGTGMTVFTSVADVVTISIDLTWNPNNTPGTDFIQRLSLDIDNYVRGPYITCIDFT